MEKAVSLCAMMPEHAGAVAALVRLAFATQSAPVDPPASALGLTESDIVAHLAGGGGAVALAGRDMPGSVMWSPKEGGLYIARLAVHPDWRGRGIAASLLSEAEQAARRLGLPRLHLGTRLALMDNRRLFARHGFTEVARHAHPGFTEPTWVEMEKRLA